MKRDIWHANNTASRTKIKPKSNTNLSLKLRLVLATPICYVLISGVAMADGKAHKYVAITAAAGVTAYLAKEQTGLDFWLQLAGSALGALCTGNLPDIFEPPVSPYHWGTFHSVGMGGTIVPQLSRLSDHSCPNCESEN
jgi:hypothetical protein